MALTKATTALDATQEIAQGAVIEGATTSVADAYDAVLQIWWALTTGTAHTGTKVIVSHSTDITGDEDWAELCSIIFGVGTTNLENVTTNVTAGDTKLVCASTSGYTAGTRIFVEDANVFANSEWVFLTGITSNSSVTTMDGMTRSHTNTPVMNSVAGTVTPIAIPMATQRIRVIYDNSYDSDGSTVAIKSELVEVTAIS